MLEILGIVLGFLVGTALGIGTAFVIIYFILDPLTAKFWDVCVFDRSERFRNAKR